MTAITTTTSWEHTQKGSLDVTDWLLWFLDALHAAIDHADGTIDAVRTKTRFWRRWNTNALNARQVMMLNRMLDGFTGKLTTRKWAHNKMERGRGLDNDAAIVAALRTAGTAVVHSGYRQPVSPQPKRELLVRGSSNLLPTDHQKLHNDTITDKEQPNYSATRYNQRMSSQSDVLSEVMRQTGTTQSELSRVSGVHQSSISQILSGKLNLSDEKLDRLLSCMGYRLEIVRRAVVPELTRSERRSWQLHSRLSTHLTRSRLQLWLPRIERNLQRLRDGVSGQPHVRNLERWESLVERGEVLELHRVFTGLDRDSIEMREVSPMGGLLSQDERADVLSLVG